MCRLFASRSRVRRTVQVPLLGGGNSLARQSVEHKDGWGIAHFDERHRVPAVALSTQPAHADPAFAQTVRAVESHAVIAHVRLASVGGPGLCNAHPFVFREWVFAHNGTLQRPDERRAQVEALIADDLRAHLRGETDSERCFLVFLTELRRDGQRRSARKVAGALARTAHALEALDVEREAPSSMNFLVTDGKLLVASRWGRSLFFAADGAESPRPGDRLEALTVASEELDGERRWVEIPERTAVGVEDDLTFARWRLAELL